MSTATEDLALATRESDSDELQIAHAQASAQHEIQSAIAIAKRFPRDEDVAFQKIIRAVKRPAFAVECSYEFPRGGKSITGPSIYLAREFARVWGNIRHGCDILNDNEDSRTIRCWAWDMETNVRVHADDTFQKLIFRKTAPDGCEVIVTTKNGVWCRPDERDLRELTNRRAALAKRNCILELLPSDFVEDALATADATLKDKAAKDPDGERKSVVAGFGSLNVPAEQLAAYLGHPIAESSPSEIAKLRQIFKSVKDGLTTWHQHLAQKQAEDASKTAAGATGEKTEQLKDKLKTAKDKKEKTSETITVNPNADDPPPLSAEELAALAKKDAANN